MADGAYSLWIPIFAAIGAGKKWGSWAGFAAFALGLAAVLMFPKIAAAVVALGFLLMIIGVSPIFGTCLALVLGFIAYVYLKSADLF